RALVVDGLREERLTDALRDPAMELAIDHHRVDPRAAVVDGDVSNDLRGARVRIDFDNGRVRAERPHEVRRIEERGGFETALHSRRETVRLKGRPRDFLDR